MEGKLVAVDTKQSSVSDTYGKMDFLQLRQEATFLLQVPSTDSEQLSTSLEEKIVQILSQTNILALQIRSVRSRLREMSPSVH